jgi:exonuclease VII large subunit
MLQQQLLNGYKNYLHKTKEKIKLMDTALYHCSFERSLEKGFCLITHEKDIITCVKQIKQIKKPCTIELILHDGQVKAHID